MGTDALGLYLHIPFCVRKCNYCDFCSFDLSSVTWRERYIDRLCKEISSYVGYKEERIKLNSIFFGGGTPSLLTPKEFQKICSAIEESFEILPDTEFTVEANPKTLDREKLRAYTECGVNRLSIGLQSIHENELKILGRIHNFDKFLESYNLARECGIDNINVDLMYGIPEQTMESFERTLDRVLALSPDHISLYGLIIEEGTPLYKNIYNLAIPSEDTECDMYYLATEKLRAVGYSHYEISNYAKSGCECRHNLKYWRSEEYIGIGLNAYSYFGGRRYANTDEAEVYLMQICENYDHTERSEPSDKPFEYVMLRLRLSEGFSLRDYEARFGRDFMLHKKEIIERFCKAGYLTFDGDRLALTERGFYVSNSIITELIM